MLVGIAIVLETYSLLHPTLRVCKVMSLKVVKHLAGMPGKVVRPDLLQACSLSLKCCQLICMGGS